MFARTLRFGLALGALLLLTGTFTRSSAEYSTRSYFGMLRVQNSSEAWGGDTNKRVPYRNLMHGTTNHGMAFQKSQDKDIPDLSRVATTYYHRKGPVGVCMERFNWFSDWKSDTYNNVDKEQGFARYDSDARIAASLAGSFVPVPGGVFPLETLTSAWSEPAYAVIGLGTGTMASYGRPFQTVHFYEIDEQIRRLSLPPEGGTTFFGYLQAAKKRGTNVQVLMGDARLRMDMPWVPDAFAAEFKETNGKSAWKIPFDQRGGPELFYHLMVVDAFSSDAIPRHLITKEAMEMYFKHLVQGHWRDLGKPGDPDYQGDKKDFELLPDGRPRFVLHPTENKIWIPGGVLCVHTSNRHLKLVPVVRDTAAMVEWDDWYSEPGKAVKQKGLKGVVRGHDSAPGNQGLKLPIDIGHFTSEWVMVARDPNDLKHLVPPPLYSEWINSANQQKRQFSTESYWQDQSPTGEFIWTDDHSNLMAVFRWPWRHD
jgi:hypothetical protein